ncbi:unnamed protein product [Victoria cruziana]
MAVSEEELGAKPKPTNSVHYLAKTVLKGSAILHVAHGRIRSPTTFDIVLGKETSIELVGIGEDGVLQSVCEQTAFGIIKDLAVLHWNDKCRAFVPQTHGKDLVVVLSDSGRLSFLTFSIKMHRFFPVAHIHLSQPGNSRYQLGRMLAVDRNGCFVAVAAYENQLAVLPVSASAGNNIVDKKILYPAPVGGGPSSTRDSQDSISGTIWSFCFACRDFCQSANEACDPILAVIIHRKNKILNELVLLEFSSRGSSIQVVCQYKYGGPLFLAVDEVPHLPGFLLLFKIGEVLLLDIRNPYHANCVYRTNLCMPISSETKDVLNECCRTLEVDDEGIFSVAAYALLELSDSGMDMSKDDDPMSIDGESGKFVSNSSFICTWDWDPERPANSKMIFCTDAGELYMLSVSCDDQGYFKVAVASCLYGHRLHCKKLLWVKGNFIAAFVEMGDGLIFKLDEGRISYQSSIQNICPILDVSVVDYHNEEQYQIFAACGMGSEGSLRIIRSGINIEKLLRTAPIYEGVTGTWSLRMKKGDTFHSFLVISFVGETRVLSVGVSFCDVTDSVGFFSDSCTVACGLVEDKVLVQICKHAVRICVPTVTAHSEGIPSSDPICKSWKPGHLSINLGAVGNNLIVVATSNPCILFILGTRLRSSFNYEIFEIQKIKLQAEVSCISVPQEDCRTQQSSQGTTTYGGGSPQALLPNGIDVCKTFVIGTHEPSVELLSLVPTEGFKVLAVGKISLTNAMGTAISWCVPQDVRIVILDQFYIVAGLRNGMLLWFQWPAISSSSPDYVIPSWTATDLPSMVLSLVTEDMQQYVTVNVNEISEGSSPVQLQLVAARRIGVTPVFLAPLSESLYADIIALCDRPWLLQTERQSQRIAYTSISFQSASHVTPICSADCPKGILFVAENCLHLVELVHMKRLNVQKFDLRGTPRRILFHSESRTLLVMRTESSNDCISMSSDICRVDPVSGSMNSCFKFDPGETPKCMQLTRVGNEQLLVVGTSLSTSRLYVYGFVNDNPQRLKKLASTRTRFTITCLTAHHNRIAVGDCRDGILFYSYLEDQNKLEPLHCDPCERLVGDCALINLETAFVSDRRGSVAGYFSYRLPTDVMKGCSSSEVLLDSADYTSVIACTLLGSVVIFVPLSSKKKNPLIKIHCLNCEKKIYEIFFEFLTLFTLIKILVVMKGREKVLQVITKIDGILFVRLSCILFLIFKIDEIKQGGNEHTKMTQQTLPKN